MNKPVILITSSILVVCACLLDFANRLTVSEQASRDGSLSMVGKGINTSFLEPVAKQRLEKILAKYDVVEPKVVVAKPSQPKATQPKVNLMTKEQQLAQNGILQGLFDGEHKFTLVATFNNSGKKFALIKQKNLLTGQETQIRLFIGESLSSYHLTQVNNNSIEFVQGDRKIHLQLFLTKNNNEQKLS